MHLYGKISRQAVRFGIVGLLSNALLYLLYLLLTTGGAGHKTAMTLLFVAGTLQTFIINKHWTFGHRGLTQSSFIKYVIAYGSAYILNLGMLFLFVDLLGCPHQIVQGLMVVVIAGGLFVLQRFWIFRVSASPEN